VKSVVAEATARRGVSVLNADDPMTIRMARHARGRLCWFSLRGGDDMPGFLRRHLAEGGRAVVLEPGGQAGRLVLHDRGERTDVIGAADIPATMGGLASFNVQNALAALAGATAIGIAPAVAGEALSQMTSSYEENPGRLNQHEFAKPGGRVRVIQDYAHNPAGLTALKGLIDRLRPELERVIGMISIPGDRRDEDIREMGEVAAAMCDVLVFRERPDGRGRKPGEIVRLLTDGALGAGFPANRIHTVLSEGGATDCALKMAEAGDLVVLLPTEVEAIWKQVLTFAPSAEASVAAPEQETALHG
jgi:cyanophycin synthetase